MLWQEGPAVAELMFEVRDVIAGPQYEEVLLAHNQRDINDRARRKAAITRLAARIGMRLCESSFRHFGESEWVRLDRMRLELGQLRVEAGL